MCFSSPKPPQAPATPASAPRLIDQGAQRARGDEKRRLRMLAGRQSTLLTGGSGLNTPAATTGNLLGAA